MLRSNARRVEAEAALRAATRADPMFAEAWYNLSDLLDEQGRSEAAIDCLRKALRAAPAYIDAIFNLTLLLQRSNKHAEAAEYWRQYLANDAQSEWAARARRSLKFCEMQIHLSASAISGGKGLRCTHRGTRRAVPERDSGHFRTAAAAALCCLVGHFSGHVSSTYAASGASSIGSTIERSSFSGLLTRVEIGHMRIRSAANGRIKSHGSGSSLTQRA